MLSASALVKSWQGSGKAESLFGVELTPAAGLAAGDGAVPELLLLLSVGLHEININGASVRKSVLRIERNLSEREKRSGMPLLVTAGRDSVNRLWKSDYAKCVAGFRRCRGIGDSSWAG